MLKLVYMKEPLGFKWLTRKPEDDRDLHTHSRHVLTNMAHMQA